MKYGLYEDPRTHRFALLPLPDRFADDDCIPVPATARWFDTRDAAVGALAGLLDAEDRAVEPPLGDTAPGSGGGRPH